VVLELFSTSSIVRVIAAVAPFSADLISAEINFTYTKSQEEITAKKQEKFLLIFLLMVVHTPRLSLPLLYIMYGVKIYYMMGFRPIPFHTISP
jgi:hypothetical protein